MVLLPNRSLGSRHFFFCHGCTQIYADNGIFAELSERIVSCPFAVANALGVDFLEKVYENALAIELRSHGVEIGQQVGIAVKYRGAPVGHCTADLVVGGGIVVEVKATTSFDPAHFAKCRNYLKATGLQLCLPINFGARGSRSNASS